MAKRSIHVARETIERHCGRWDVDILSGWEKGIGPKRRVGCRLYDHSPPDHLTGERYADWMLGYRRGQEYREKMLQQREIHFVGKTRDGEEVVIRRKGWSSDRGRIITQMARRGVLGDVWVFYFEKGDLVRQVRCGI